MSRTNAWLARAAYAAPPLVFLVVYGACAGHGFIRDDFAWIQTSSVHGVSDVLGLLQRDNGFYRPVVSLTFAIDRWLFGMHPLGYGLTNVAIAFAGFLAIRRLGLALGLTTGGAYVAASIWLLNLQFIRTGVLWISGRTSLLGTLFAVLAATAFVRRRPLASAAWLLLALFSKEETILLPLVLLLWSSRQRLALLLFAAAEGLYFFARTQTSAATPFSAMGSYRYDLTAGRLAQNLPEYVDRSMSLAILVVVLAVVTLGLVKRSRAAIVEEVTTSSAVFWFCAWWWALTFAPTFMLPSRSDLYACLPAVGACLLAGRLVSRCWTMADVRRHRHALIAALLLVMTLAPLHYARASRRVRVAEVSDQVLKDLESLTAGLADRSTVIVEDDTSRPRMNITEAFGVELDHAFELQTGRRLRLWIEPALTEDSQTIGLPPCPTCAAMRLRFVEGRLTK